MKKKVDPYKKYEKTDKFFSKIFNQIQDASPFLDPVNFADEKEKFLKSDIYEPKFKYKRHGLNLNKIKKEIKEHTIEKGDLKKFFEEFREYALLITKSIESIGKAKKIRKYSSQIYGWPSNKLLQEAKKVIREEFEKQKKYKEFKASKVKKEFSETLKHYKIKGWKIKYREKHNTGINNFEKVIFLCKNRIFSQKEISRLTIHEIGVHVLRCQNGAEQKINMLAYGTPQYLKTEEGLAIYFEDITKTLNPRTLRSYAGRVLAIHKLKEGHSFRETFNYLKRNDFSNLSAWNITLRVYQAGGFIKDHVYLKGYLEIKKYVKEGGDISKLYLGKIAIEDLPLVDKLLKKKLLKEAKYVPDIIKNK